jgi:hypothetical protein
MSMPNGSTRQVAVHVAAAPRGPRLLTLVPYGHPAVPARGRQIDRVNLGVEVSVNPESHPWTDAADSC